MKCVNIEFKSGGKQYIFFDNNIELSNNDYVIVQTERGEQFGKVVSIFSSKNEDKNHSLVLKKASEKDIVQNAKNIKEAKEAIEKAQKIANDKKLEMKFIDGYFTFDRKQLVLQFFSDNRVDFRELAKDLANIYKTRIELRQVGVRDKAKEVSGIGTCGRKICCSTFLNDMDSVGISQVKNQNVSLNPNKINGLCGRLLCCLKYEDDLYTEFRKDLPEVGDKVKYNNEMVDVINIDIPRRQYTIINSDGNKEIITVPYKRSDKNGRNSNK